MSAFAPLIPLRLDTPAVLETSQDFGGQGGRAKAGFLPSIQKPASTRKIRPDGSKRRISAFSRDVFPAAADAAFVGRNSKKRPKTCELLAFRCFRARKHLRLRTRRLWPVEFAGEQTRAFLQVFGSPPQLALRSINSWALFDKISSCVISFCGSRSLLITFNLRSSSAFRSLYSVSRMVSFSCVILSTTGPFLGGGGADFFSGLISVAQSVVSLSLLRKIIPPQLL